MMLVRRTFVTSEGNALALTPFTHALGRTRQSKTFHGTKADAEQELSRWAGQVEREQPKSQVDRAASVRNLTLNQLIERHLAHLDVETLTLKGYRAKHESFIADSPIGKLRANRVTALEVTSFFRQLYDSGKVKHTTLCVVRAVLSGAYKFALSQEIGLITNPVAAAAFPRNRDLPSNVGAPEPEVIQQILKGAHDAAPDTLTAFTVSTLTGVRRGELAAVRRSCIERVNGVPYIHVHQSVVTLSASDVPRPDYVPAGPHRWLKSTKGHANRRFRLDDAVAGVLERHLAWLEVRANLAGVLLVDDPFLFSLLPDCSQPPRPDYLTAVWGKLRQIPGFNGVRLHDLRHFNGTALGSAGASPTTIKERLGHKSIRTTERYVKRTYEDDRRAAETLGEVGKLLF